jgi:aspartate kinase
LKILKFGGTSVGVAANAEQALRIVRAAAIADPVIVVSALSGVTNLLVDVCRPEVPRTELLARLLARHRDHAKALEVQVELLEPQLAALAADVAALPAGTAPSREVRDRLLAHGERLAARIFAAALSDRGTPARDVFAGDAGLVTDERFGQASPLPEAAGLLAAGLAQRDQVPVVTGFLGRTRDHRVTTLGRGGSDYSAALIGAALGAEVIEIWTDTSGMLSADPRVVPEARPVPQLSFAEACELAYFGARVLHPKTLLPAMERAIPVRVLNTARPDDPGSLITATAAAQPEGWRVRSIASKPGITAVTIASTRMLLAHGFLARVFEVFGRHHVVVDLVTTSEVSISVTVDDTSRLAPALAELEAIGRVEVRPGLAVVAVVGEGAPTQVGLAGHVFTLLGGIGVPVEMISQGASRVNLSFVVAEREAARVVRLLHRGLGLDAEVATSASSTPG